MIRANKERFIELARYHEGEVTRSQAEEIERGLENSAAARAELARVRVIAQALGARDVELEQVDMVARVRQAIVRESTAAPRVASRRWLVFAGWGSAAALAAVLAVVVIGPQLVTQSAEDSAFRAKSAAGAVPERERWVGIDIFRAEGQTGSAKVERAIAVRDELLFAYRNLGPSPFRYLMIFAVDNAGQIYWYYPAFTDSRTDPASVPIREGESVELPEKVRHAFAKGHLAVHAVFSDRELNVSRVEQAVRDAVRMNRPGTAFHAKLSLPDTAERIALLRVE